MDLEQRTIPKEEIQSIHQIVYNQFPHQNCHYPPFLDKPEFFLTLGGSWISHDQPLGHSCSRFLTGTPPKRGGAAPRQILKVLGVP